MHSTRLNLMLLICMTLFPLTSAWRRHHKQNAPTPMPLAIQTLPVPQHLGPAPTLARRSGPSQPARAYAGPVKDLQARRHEFQIRNMESPSLSKISKLREKAVHDSKLKGEIEAKQVALRNSLRSQARHFIQRTPEGS